MNREEHKDLVVEKRKAIMQRDPAVSVQEDSRDSIVRFAGGMTG
jgi:hypothetical protein